MKIIIQPIGKDINNNILNSLYDFISIEFNNIDVTIAPILKTDIHSFINRQRNQVRSSDLLHWILEKLNQQKK